MIHVSWQCVRKTLTILLSVQTISWTDTEKDRGKGALRGTFFILFLLYTSLMGKFP